MEGTKKVENLENEIQELRLKITTLEEGIKNAETFINNIKNNPNTISGDSNKDSQNKDKNPEVSVSVSNLGPTPPAKAYHSKKTKVLPLINLKKDESSTSNQNTEDQDNEVQSIDNQNISDKQSIIDKSSKKIQTESWIGKFLMGAIASILIFIALITFAKIFLPYLTDTVKIILMFVASIALTVVGFIFNKKKPENTFYKSLLGCGSGCIYLSILVTGVYFKAIDLIVMYILFAIWAVIIIFFKKDKNDWLFFAIGNLGYLVSIIFTCGLKDNTLIIPLLIYVVVICVIYQIMYWKNVYQRYAQNVINTLSLIIFQMIMTALFKGNGLLYPVGIVTMVYTFVVFMAYILLDVIKYQIVHFYIAAFNSVMFIIAYLIMTSFNYDNLNTKPSKDIIMLFTVFIIPAIAFEAINMYWRIKKYSERESIINIFYSGLLFILAAKIVYSNNHFIFNSGILVIVYSLIIFYGIIKKDMYFRIQGWALISICMFIRLPKCPLPFLIIATTLTVVLFIMEGVIVNDSDSLKIVSYIALIVWIVRIGVKVNEDTSINKDTIVILTYGTIALLNAGLILTKFYRKKDKTEKEGIHLHPLLDGFNLVYILFSIIKVDTLKSDKETALMVIYIIIGFSLAFINLPLKRKVSQQRYIYSVGKMAILIYHSLWAFNTPKFVISICMITYAVVCIFFGFWKREIGKPLRICGLVMTLLFVVKLIILDITYDSSVLKALSYLISGALCFGISAIYNYFEKKGKDTKKENLESLESLESGENLENAENPDN